MNPRVHQGIPYCSEDSCQEYDGKRCRLLGQRPGNICEPAVDEIVAERNELRNHVPGLTATLDETRWLHTRLRRRVSALLAQLRRIRWTHHIADRRNYDLVRTCIRLEDLLRRWQRSGAITGDDYDLWSDTCRVLNRTCCCAGNPGSYEGPMRDCPVHGE